MATKGSSYGDIHRYEPPRESTAAAIGIVLLTVVQIVLVGLFTWGLVKGWGVANPAADYPELGNVFLGTLLGGIFINLAFILVLYRKEFLPDVMIVKKRRRKWEDLYVSEDDADGQDFNVDDAWDQVKRAIYPYYKR